MSSKNPKQLILSNLEKEKYCLKDLMAKLKDQKQAIENQDEGQVLKIIEDKNVLIVNF